MNDLFIPYQQSLDLKELGFDQSCLTKFEDCFNKTKLYPILSTISLNGPYENEYHGYDQKIINDIEKRWFFTGYKNSVKDHNKNVLTAPLYQQAFKFFRDKGYAIMDKPFFSSKDTPNITYAKDIIHWSSGKVYKGARFNSYEESELDCLKKLIELEKK